MKKLLLLFVMMMGGLWAFPQEMTVKKAAFYDKTPPLRDMQMIVPGARDRSWKDNVIRNEADPRFEDIDRSRTTLPIGPDPVWQSQMGPVRTNEPIQNFEGTNNVNGVYPPDTDGDVGPDHYYQMINLSFQIFDKEGNSLYGPADNSTIWDNFIGPWTGTNDGDPITLYDEEADRWMVSQFAVNTDDGSYWELIAVSKTGDPLGEYYRYAFEFPAFNDYPKFGLWNDAYYCSFNMFGEYNRVAGAAFERDAMLEGDPDARMVLFDLPEGSEPWSMMPSDYDGALPPDGTPNYFAFAHDDFFGGADQIKIWEFDVDWNNVENSTFEEAYAIDVAPFDSEICPAYRGRCIHQPMESPKLEALAGRLMFRLQYRNFGMYEAMVTNHTVDVDGTGHAGVRWYEFRDYNDGNGWQLHQQGTYAPDSDHRWMASIAMNEEGFIALGYSVSSNDTYPSIRYTGRGPNAPLGEMVFTEETIIDGGGVQFGEASRWGDYSKMSVDPTDQKTFWFTTEYMEHSGSAAWQTRVASFQLEEDFTAPEAVSDLGAQLPTTNGVWLNWTSTSDNLGTPYLYDVRYSTSPITEENWSDATPAAGEPEPSEAGTVEQFYVPQLNFSQQYYFGLKVADRQYNYSGLSNIANASIPGQPDIHVATEAIDESVFQGFSRYANLTIENNGESDIRYHLTKRDTLPSNPGEIVKTYENAGSSLLGMHHMDGEIYLVSSSMNSLLIYDTTEHVLTDTVLIHEDPFGITSDGEKLWIGSNDGMVRAYHFDGSPANDSINYGAGGYHAMACDGEHLLINELNQVDPVIYKYSLESGELDGSYTVNIDKDIWQSTWVEEHQDGKLWITNNDGEIAQLALDEETATFSLVQEFEAPSLLSYAISHSGSDFLYANIHNTIQVIDDGVSEVNWLIPETVEDTIPSGESQQLEFLLVSQKLQPGEYFAYVTIYSNDPDQGEIEVPVRFTVTPYTGVSVEITGVPAQICQGNAYELLADAQGGNPPLSYTWVVGSEEFSNDSIATIIPESDITYYVTVSDGLSMDWDSVNVVVQPSPQFTVGGDTTMCVNHQLSLTIPEGYVSYEWSDGSVGNQIIVDSTKLDLGENTIWGRAEGENGCKTTDTIFIAMDLCEGLDEQSLSQIRVYPNPVKGNVFLEGISGDVKVMVRDINGKEIFRESLRDSETDERFSINVSRWEAGTYFIIFESERQKSVKKLLKIE